MASIVPIASLTDTVHNVRVQARIMKVWQAFNPAKGHLFGMNFVLLDKQGGAIQGLILMKEFNKFKEHFVEGRLCEFRKFTVGLARTGFRVVPNTFSLTFAKYSHVEALPVASLDIPLYYFRFGQLEEVGKKLSSSSDLLDVVVRIVGFGPIDTVAGKSGMVRVGSLYVANERGYTLDISLWEDFIDLFDVPALIEHSRVSPVIVACSSLQVRKFEAKISKTVIYGLKTFGGTRFYFDAPLPDVTAFRSSLPADLPPVFADGAGPLRGIARPGALPAGKSPPKRVTLAELAALDSPADSDTFECVVRISDVTTRFDWYYLSCPNCHRKIDDPELDPNCGREGCAPDNILPVAWYRFTVRVDDQTGHSRFVLIGRQAEIVVGASADVVAAPEGPETVDAPARLLEIIGKQFAFVIAAREANQYAHYRSYTVQRVNPVPPDYPVLQLLGPANLAEAGTSVAPTTPAPLSRDGDGSDLGTAVLAVEPLTASVLPVKRAAADDDGPYVVTLKDVKRRLHFSGVSNQEPARDVDYTANSAAHDDVS